jgi:hypothetical protein
VSDELDIDELLKWFDEQEKSKKLRLENPLVLDIIRALMPYPRRRRPDVIDAVFYARNDRGNRIPPTFENSVQTAFNQHNRDSSVWQKTADARKAIFYCPGGSGSGWWAVDKERAREWLRAQKFEEES